MRDGWHGIIVWLLANPPVRVVLTLVLAGLIVKYTAKLVRIVLMGLLIASAAWLALHAAPAIVALVMSLPT